jgi:hypothetical protein
MAYQRKRGKQTAKIFADIRWYFSTPYSPKYYFIYHAEDQGF